jgi:protein SCO1
MNKAFLAALLLLLAACGPQHEEPPLAGAAIGGPFALVDQDGKPATEASFAGKYRLMYFGYTSCPDVCPLDLQKLAQGYALLAKDDTAKADKLQPIFVTVDPARDTPAALKAYVTAFSPKLIGLTGSEAEIAKVAKEFGIYYRKEDPKPGADPKNYLVDHMRAAMLFGPDGKPIALIPQDGTPDQIAKELSRWIV